MANSLNLNVKLATLLPRPFLFLLIFPPRPPPFTSCHLEDVTVRGGEEKTQNSSSPKKGGGENSFFSSLTASRGQD